jgi:hypothetical protein
MQPLNGTWNPSPSLVDQRRFSDRGHRTSNWARALFAHPFVPRGNRRVPRSDVARHSQEELGEGYPVPPGPLLFGYLE